VEKRRTECLQRLEELKHKKLRKRLKGRQNFLWMKSNIFW